MVRIEELLLKSNLRMEPGAMGLPQKINNIFNYGFQKKYAFNILVLGLPAVKVQSEISENISLEFVQNAMQHYAMNAIFVLESSVRTQEKNYNITFRTYFI